MGRSNYGAAAGTSFITKEAVNTLQAVEAAALTLKAAVSTSLVAAVTGASGAGSMDRNVKTTLSSSYSATSGSIF